MGERHNKTDGECPYCGGDNLTDYDDAASQANNRPDRTVRKCGDCKQYAVEHTLGRVYPLDEPSNPASSPYG